uniref:Uncharacterized protein n=1 Tax=Peronospora matthiolae TaxID=2874970 RepID=A0AAV1TFN7_9STRA
MEPLPLAEVARRVGVKRDVFFRRVLVSDADVQQQMLARISDELQELLAREDATLVTDFFPTALRLTLDAPFPAIREALGQIVHVVEHKYPEAQELRARQTRVSYFFSNGHAPEDEAAVESVARVDANDDEALQSLFQDSFLRTGRVTHLMQILAWHRSYLELFDRSLAATMTRDGTLPLHWGSYIAVMGASELRCHYLADLQQYNFVVNGGDSDWIKGLDYVPPKLFRLHELSSLLAHRPWLLTAEHVAELLRSDQDDSWSVSELVHAIIVLCQAHSMASIALGVGCAEEVDLAVFGQFGYALDAESLTAEDVDRHEATDASSCSSVDLSTIDRDDEMPLKQLKKNSNLDSDTADEEEEVGDEQQQQQDGEDEAEDEDKYGTDDGFEVVVDEAAFGVNAPTDSRRMDTLWRFCGGSVIRYTDFDVRSEEYEVLHTEDFSWDEHCFSLVKRYFPGEAGQILEDLFNLTSKLTYDCFGANKDEFVDTSPYRDAVWYYVHRIFGICHDDYDYRLVNTYLNRPTKIFLKKVACTPWKVRKEDFAHFDRVLRPSEKCHVILLVAEARKQAGLMYGLRAVMNHMR